MCVQLFIGQVMGTSVGSKVFTAHGWRADAALNLAWSGFTLAVLLARGPHVPRYTWLGWAGGCELRKSRVLARQQEAAAVNGEKEEGEEGPDRERADGVPADGEDLKEPVRDADGEKALPVGSLPTYASQGGRGEKTDSGGTDEREPVDMV